MRYRSWLFVPGDSERKLQKAAETGADILVLDLEDSVLDDAKPRARELVAEYLAAQPVGTRRSGLWVRINPVSGSHALRDLVAIVRGAPDGIVVPKADGPAELQTLSHYLDALEAREGLEAGHIRLLPVATETPLAPFRLGDYASAGLDRLLGLTWGAEDLSTALGASTNRDSRGELALSYRMVRSMCLLAAKAAGVMCIDTVYTNIPDLDGLRRSCIAARQEGFNGRIAIHPDQVAPINEAFTPTEAELEFARRVIAAFAANPGAGAVKLDGRMLDIPHLRQAQKLLEQVGETQ